jgi:hypothetical protein
MNLEGNSEYFKKLKLNLIQKAKEYFIYADLNNNGHLEIEEWVESETIYRNSTLESFDQTYTLIEFDDLDLNNDGKLTLDEFLKSPNRYN